MQSKPDIRNNIPSARKMVDTVCRYIWYTGWARKVTTPWRTVTTRVGGLFLLTLYLICIEMTITYVPQKQSCYKRFWLDAFVLLHRWKQWQPSIQRFADHFEIYSGGHWWHHRIVRSQPIRGCHRTPKRPLFFVVFSRSFSEKIMVLENMRALENMGCLHNYSSLKNPKIAMEVARSKSIVSFWRKLHFRNMIKSACVGFLCEVRWMCS